MSLLSNILRRTSKPHRKRRSHDHFSRVRRARLGAEPLESREMMNADPVLMVIADQQDFYYQEYGDTRLSLEAAGLEVRVAATTTNPSTPHPNSGQGSRNGVVTPDLALADVDPDDYSAIVFVGGWGSSMYQYDFPGDYQFDHYDGDRLTKEVVNNLIDEFVQQDKHVAAICHGVTVLAWARVDGVSLLEGRQVSVPYIGSPAAYYEGQYYGNYDLSQYEQAVANGATANLVSGQYGDPNTATDDVVVDGRIITAENYDAALEFGRRVAQEVLTAAGVCNEQSDDQQTPNEDSGTGALPVLMVISNQDFWYQDYSDTRAAMEATNVPVIVAAESLDVATPHPNSGQGFDCGYVRPDVTLYDAQAKDYSAVVFVGGWGMSSYQYAYEGTYDNTDYNGSTSLKTAVNDLINDFVDQDKYITALCHGVSVLAWARVDGASLLEGRTVVGWGGAAPSVDGTMGTTRDQIEANGATMLASGSVGDPATSLDDVVVDGRIITAENYESAAMFGRIIAEHVTEQQYVDQVDRIFTELA